MLEPDERGRRRRFRAWIFTPVVSRYRFVYPCFAETTETAIEACEAAWEFFGGVFRVVVPDNTKAIVQTADPREPRIIDGFLEYAQARGFHVDPTRARHPKDKARVERSVRDVRDDCFGGEQLLDLDDARAAARTGAPTSTACAGTRRRSGCRASTSRPIEKPRLLPAPTAPYDVPLWCEPKVGARSARAGRARALLAATRVARQAACARAPTARRCASTIRSRASSSRRTARVAPGERSTDPTDFPPEKAVYADARRRRLPQARAQPRRARSAGSRELLAASPLPWTRMRQLYALLGLVQRYGAARVDETCARRPRRRHARRAPPRADARARRSASADRPSPLA